MILAPFVISLLSYRVSDDAPDPLGFERNPANGTGVDRVAARLAHQVTLVLK